MQVQDLELVTVVVGMVQYIGSLSFLNPNLSIRIMKNFIFYLSLIVSFIFVNIGETKAQKNPSSIENKDSLDFFRVTLGYTTPSGIAVMPSIHIAHPETNHPYGWRGYYIYRRESEKDKWKKLNKEPLAAPTTVKEFIEVMGVDNYQRLMRDFKINSGEELMNKLKSGDNEIASLAYMFNTRLADAVGMVYYDRDVVKGKTYQYMSTKVLSNFIEGDSSVSLQSVTYGVLDSTFKSPKLINLKLKDKVNADTTELEKARKKTKIKKEKKAESLKDIAINIQDSLTKNEVSTVLDTLKDVIKMTEKEILATFKPITAGYYYYLLRSKDSLGTFIPIHSIPLISSTDSITGETKEITIKDTTITTTQTYYYSACMEDRWGNRYMSDLMKITITPPLPPVPQELDAKTTSEGIKLTWDKLEYEYLSGFNLYKKINQGDDTVIVEKVNTQLIPAEENSFLETKVKPGQIFQFFIKAADKFEQESLLSSQVKIVYENKRSPLPPLGVQAKANADAKSITISWEANTEGDISGYTVLRARNVNDIPTIMTSSILGKEVLTYIDTARIYKNVDYYYYVRAMNLTGYESPLSQYTVIRISEKIKPQRINSLAGYADLLQGNKLTWDTPFDEKTDKVRLYKTSPTNATTPTLIYEEMISDGRFSFRDKDIKAGIEYKYVLRGVSLDSLESDDSDPVNLFITPEPLQAPDRLSITPQADGSLLLKWIPNFQDGLAGFNVYRISYKGGKKRLTSTPILRGTNTYLDKDIQKDEIYYYFVRSVDAGGFEGIDSEQVKFEMITPEK